MGHKSGPPRSARSDSERIDTDKEMHPGSVIQDRFASAVLKSWHQTARRLVAGFLGQRGHHRSSRSKPSHAPLAVSPSEMVLASPTRPGSRVRAGPRPYGPYHSWLVSKPRSPLRLDRAADIAYRADPGVERNNEAADTALCRELRTFTPAGKPIHQYPHGDRHSSGPPEIVHSHPLGRPRVYSRFPGGQTCTTKGFLMDRRMRRCW